MLFKENQFGRPEIPSSQLTADKVPAANAPYHTEIIDFALGFDGYARFSDRVSTIASQAQQEFNRSGKLPRTVDRLRGCLFFQQRFWRNDGGDPDAESMLFIGAVLDAIRTKVKRRR